ncbi:hypothetical protein [Actinoplanes sp. NPDC049265]|uniref:hypothetical protein n=1 Tax=Actinoplanes sp. NPDC049265 TaxID=3363902 RepID=UPI0037206789
MAFDASRYVVGDEWVYRLRDTEPSERVRIKAVTPKKTTASIEVEFLDGGHRVQTVPSSRLKTRWANVEAYDAQQAAWQRIADFDEPESAVPAGLAELPGPQQAFAEFLRLDRDLLAVAAAASAPLVVKAPSDAALKRWVKAQSAVDKDEWLLRILRGDGAHLRVEMLRVPWDLGRSGS